MRKRVLSVVLALILCLSCMAQCVAAQGVESLSRYGITEEEKNSTIGFFKYIGAQDAVDTLTKGKYSKYVILKDEKIVENTNGREKVRIGRDATSLVNFATSLIFAELGNEYVSQSTMHKVLYMTDNSMARAEANADFLMGDYPTKQKNGEDRLVDEAESISFFFPVPYTENVDKKPVNDYPRITLDFYEELAQQYLEKAIRENLRTLSSGSRVHYSYLNWAYNSRAGLIYHKDKDTGEQKDAGQEIQTNALVYCLGESDNAAHGTVRTAYDYRRLLTDYYENVSGYPHENHVWIYRPAFYGRGLNGKYQKISPAYTFCFSCGALKQTNHK